MLKIVKKEHLIVNLLRGASLVLAVTDGIASSVQCGDFNFKLPTKKSDRRSKL